MKKIKIILNEVKIDSLKFNVFAGFLGILVAYGIGVLNPLYFLVFVGLSIIGFLSRNKFSFFYFGGVILSLVNYTWIYFHRILIVGVSINENLETAISISSMVLFLIYAVYPLIVNYRKEPKM